jgi:cell wall-associated NlpC family hydrolase
MPYKYGGGHGQWNDTGYDCSGSVSYALRGGGLLSSALTSRRLHVLTAPPVPAAG